MSDLILALDIGGTKIAAALVDSGGVLVHREQLPTPHADSEQVWAAVDALVGNALAAAAERPVCGIGVGCAGPSMWSRARSVRSISLSGNSFR